MSTTTVRGLDYPLGDPPAPGHAREIAPGVLWIRMPMPFALDHINLWAIRDGAAGDPAAGWALVDSGLQTLDTATAWRNLLTGSGVLAGQRITRVLVTHMHPDHIGMAGWMTRRFDCRLWMTRLRKTACASIAGPAGAKTTSRTTAPVSAASAR